MEVIVCKLEMRFSTVFFVFLFVFCCFLFFCFFCQAEDGIRDLVRSRGLGDVYKRQLWDYAGRDRAAFREEVRITLLHELGHYLGLDEDQVAQMGLA